MWLFRQPRHLKSQTQLYLLYLLLIGAVAGSFTCTKPSEHSKSNRIFQNYLRYFTENNVDFLAQYHFDDHLVQVSAANFKAYQRTIEFYEEELALLDTIKLSRKNQVDFVLLKRHLRQLRFDYQTRKIWQHDPLWYLQLLGNSFYWPTVTPGRNQTEVAENLLSRLKQMPRFLRQAQSNLVAADARRISLAQNQGITLENFLNQTCGQLTESAPAITDSLNKYRPAALLALHEWREFLKNSLLTDARQMTSAEFTEWLGLLLGEDFSLSKLQEICAQELDRAPERMRVTTREVYRKYFSRRKFQQAAQTDAFQITEALNSIQNNYLKNDAILPFIQETVSESERFIRLKDLLKLANFNKIIYLPLPEFLASELFGNLVIHQAQPFFLLQLKSSDWKLPDEQDFLRYFNPNRLKVLALGQILPGQMLQMLYADSLATPVQRYFGDRVIQAGWPMFAPYLMRKAGFSGYDPAFILTQQLEELHAALGAHLCLEYHLNGMDENRVRQAFATQGFVDGVVLDARLNEIFLAPEKVLARFWGYVQLQQLYDEVMLHQQGNFNLVDFYQKILDSGFIPISMIRHYLLQP